MWGLSCGNTGDGKNIQGDKKTNKKIGKGVRTMKLEDIDEKEVKRG